jgi:hypothetical protein
MFGVKVANTKSASLLPNYPSEVSRAAFLAPLDRPFPQTFLRWPFLPQALQSRL